MGKNSEFEFGGYVKLMYTHDLAKNINFLTRADFFSNYLKNPQNIDVNWETLFTFKVNSWFSATLSTLLIYDCLLYTSPSPRDRTRSRMPSSA